jgi:hypothetical protein
MKKRIFKWLLGLVLIGLLLLSATPVSNWDGSVGRPLKINIFVMDAETPLPGVRVLVSEMHIINQLHSINEDIRRDWMKNLYEDRTVGDTDIKGVVDIRVQCPAGGSNGLFGNRTGRFRITHMVEINHPGFRPLLIPLASLLGEQSFPLSKKVLEAKVWLIPVPPDTVSKPIK